MSGSISRQTSAKEWRVGHVLVGYAVYFDGLLLEEADALRRLHEVFGAFTTRPRSTTQSPIWHIELWQLFARSKSIAVKVNSSLFGRLSAVLIIMRAPPNRAGFRKVRARHGFFAGEHVARQSREYYLTAGVSAARAELHDVVGLFHYVYAVFDEEQRVARVGQLVEELHERLYVVEVQAVGRLVEDEDGAALVQVRGELDALELAARERRHRLVQMQVAEARAAQRGELFTERAAREEFRGLRRRSCP